MRFLTITCCALAFAGCLSDTRGIDPPSDRMIYPVGLATLPGDDQILVLNSNFDLEFNAGTLIVIDIDALENAQGEASQDDDELYLDQSSLTRVEETVRLGAFASDLELTPRGDRALVPVRGERSILVLDLDPGGSDLVSCGEGDDRRCDAEHRIESTAQVTMPIEPYEVGALDYVEANGALTTLGFATHLAGGEVSLFKLRDGAADSRTAAELIAVTDEIIPAASGIAVNPVTREIYVSSRSIDEPEVAVLKVLTDSDSGWYSENPYFGRVGSIDLGEDLALGNDARGLAVDPAGGRAWLVTRTPEALVALDLDERGIVDLTSVGSEPSTVRLLRHDGGTPEDPADDRLLAFVLCFLSDQVFVIDPDLMQVLAVRRTGRGPQAITFDATRHRAFVANFRESTLTVISTDPPYDHLRDADGRVIKIGKPRLPKGHD